MKNKNKGFTLIELIVTITIIGVVSVVAIVNFGGTNKKARDNRRMADLDKTRIALELYRQENAMYPPTLQTLVTSTYLQELPVDPKAGFTYVYTIGTSYAYTLDAQMENIGQTNGDYGAGCGTTPGSVCNYRVVNP